MSEIKITGNQSFMGKEIPIVEGGFGDNQKVVTVDMICKVHDARTDKVNELISNNIDEFEEGIDIIDLMVDINSLNLAKGLGLITNNRQKHCYILSEQGYMLLAGFMKTEKAKEVRKNLRREYFTMREVIKSDEQLKAKLLYQLYIGGIDSVEAHKRLSDIEIKEATTPLLEKIENDSPYVELAKKRLDGEGLISVTELNDIFESKRGRITKWLKSNGYIHKTSTEVNKKGKGYFRVYLKKGFTCIGATEDGVKLINDNIELIKK